MNLPLTLASSLFTIAVFSGPGTAQAAQPSPTAGPLGVVRGLVEAMNAGDLEAARALFAEDGYSAYGVDGTPHVGEGLDAWLQSDIVGPGAQFEIRGECVLADGTAVIDGRWGSGGDLSGAFLYLFSVENERVGSWTIVDPYENDNPCSGR